LARDDRGEPAHDDEGVDEAGRRGDERVEHVALGDRGGVEEPRPLAEVVQDEGGPHDEEPGAAYGPAAEVPHVGVEGLAPGDAEVDRAHDEERRFREAEHVRGGVHRVDGSQNLGVFREVVAAHRGEAGEPHRHRGGEDGADLGRAEALDPEERDEGHDGERGDVGRPPVGDDLEPLPRAHDREGRGDDAVAQDEPGADDGEPDDDGHPVLREAPFRAVLQKSEDREEAALALVVGPHDEHDVLERDDDGDRPEEERRPAEDLVFAVVLADPEGDLVLDAVHRGEVRRDGLAHRVEGRGADVAEDDAEGGPDERAEGGRGVMSSRGFLRRGSGCGDDHPGISRPESPRSRERAPNLYAFLMLAYGWAGP
jgi:hypothetical protein